MKYYHPSFLILLLGLTFAWLLLYWYRQHYNKNAETEGFQQERPFVSKTGSDIYDSFYTEIYDELMKSDLRAENLLDAIIHVTEPTLRYSSFLDIGCGTGSMLEQLSNKGYRATGIDRSQDMVSYCQQKLSTPSSASVLHGDVLDSMQFDRAQFSHVICTNTLYEWNDSDKLKFFRNCYFWIIAGGYLFLHIVDPDKFSPIVLAASKPTAVPVSSILPTQRITRSDIDFMDFTYKSFYNPTTTPTTDSCRCVSQRETFTDTKTQHVRENEILLHMSPIDSIVSLALRSGFVVKAKWNLLDSPYSDAYQYMYVFERTL
jgi:SAM-dependent methyltransferase